VLAYSNAALPHALLLCGKMIPDSAMTEAGLESLAWLADLQRAEAEGGHFVPVGSNGFYRRGGELARFDQQPIEAQAMVSACLGRIGSPATGAGARRPTAPSSGSSAATTCMCRSTIPPRAAVATGCTRIDPMRTRVPSRCWPFSRHSWSCAWRALS
jgi:hypothetical protein